MKKRRFLIIYFLLVVAILFLSNKHRGALNKRSEISFFTSESPLASASLDEEYVTGPFTLENTTGDLWFSTWADDDNLYISWGDGKGFGEQLSDVGIAKLMGNLPKIQGENVYNEKHPGVLHFDQTDKPSSLLYVNNRLYGHFFSPTGLPNLGYNAYSDDYGQTWIKQKDSPWTLSQSSNFICLFFINMGKNYEHALDDYVYAFGLARPGGKDDGIFLTRVDKNHIMDYRAYEYYSGVRGETPLWSESQADAIAVPNLVTKSQVSAAYHPGVKRFILLTSNDVFDAPNPWGPWNHTATWRTDSMTGWIGGYQPGIISKNMDQDSFWFTISGQPDKGSDIDYKLNLAKINLLPR